jgi:16S rRNA processing protein RimM
LSSKSPGKKREEMAPPAPAGRITIARVVKPQGRHGELLAELHTDSSERFNELKRVWLWKDGGSEAEFTLRRSWQHKGRVVLSLESIDDISTAERWVGAEVQISVEQRVAAVAGHYFVSDLVGCTLYDSGHAIGRIESVEENAGGTLLHVRSSGAEILVPLAQEYIRQVDPNTKRINLELPEGLIDLNK